MANPTKLTWTQPKANVDGSVFDVTQFAGFQIAIDGKPAVSIPIAWNDVGTYELPLAGLSLSFAQHVVGMQTIAKNGAISAMSNTATFTLKDERVPKAPLDLLAG